MLSCLPLAYIVYLLGYPPYSISYVYLATSFLTFFVTILLLNAVVKFDIKTYLKKSVMKMAIVMLCVLPTFLIPKFMHPGTGRFFVSVLMSEVMLVGSIITLGIDGTERESMCYYFKLAMNKLHIGTR